MVNPLPSWRQSKKDGIRSGQEITVKVVLDGYGNGLGGVVAHPLEEVVEMQGHPLAVAVAKERQ